MPDPTLFEAVHHPDSCVTGSLLGANESGTVIKLIPLFCHKWTCPQCRKIKAYKWRDIAVAGNPQRFITLTLKENKRLTVRYQAQIIKDAFPKLVAAARKEFGEFEYMMVFELTKKGTPHVHLLQRGAFIPKAWLSRTWRALTGAFVVDIKKIFNPKDVGNYITKYLGKTLGDVSLLLSGMRIIVRSKKWIVDDHNGKSAAENQGSDDCFDWTYASYLPAEAIKILISKYGYTVDTNQSAGCIEIHGPPTEDIIPQLIWPLIDR